ncbi:MAG: alpha-galactosidase, partial [Thermoguttaceae bacterium]|nr:alpha-galactosidase [Thermoguttaceae bacterium]
MDGKSLHFSKASKERTWNTSVEKKFNSVEDSGQREDAFPRDEVIRERYERVDKKTGIKIVFELDRYKYYPVSEGVLWFENISDSDSPNLKDVYAFDGVLPTGGFPFLTTGKGEDPDPVQNYSLQRLPLQLGTPLFFEPMEGYPSYGAFPYFLLEGKLRSYIIAIGWTGSWRASFDVDKLGNVHFCAGQKDVDLYLKPGEKIRTPRITLFDFPTGADAVNLWRDWYRRYVMPRENGNVLRPKFVLDVFYRGELYDKVTAEEQIDAIRKLRSLGYPCEGLWVDAGWYLRGDKKIDSAIGRWFAVGDWTPDPNRFPDGFRPVVEELENVPEGTPPGKLTLWYEPERVHRSALNEELKAFVVPACEIVESFRMNMASKETVDYLSETIGRSLAENKVKIYRQD